MDENPYKSPSAAQPNSDGFPSERFVIVFCGALLAVIACFVIGGTISFLHESFVPHN